MLKALLIPRHSQDTVSNVSDKRARFSEIHDAHSLHSLPVASIPTVNMHAPCEPNCLLPSQATTTCTQLSDKSSQEIGGVQSGIASESRSLDTRTYDIDFSSTRALFPASHNIQNSKPQGDGVYRSPAIQRPITDASSTGVPVLGPAQAIPSNRRLGYGTLVLGSNGTSKYLGPTAASEWLKDVSYNLVHTHL